MFSGVNSVNQGQPFVYANVNPTNFDKLQFDITSKLMDPEKAQVIRSIYEKNTDSLGRIWNKFASSDFQEWLVEQSKLLGSLGIDHLDLAMRTFPSALLREFSDPSGYKKRCDALSNFAAELQKAWGHSHKEVIIAPKNVICIPSPDDPNRVYTIYPWTLAALVHRNIVVLYKTCGNGHFTASVGIQQFLEERGFQIHLINGGLSEKQFKANTIIKKDSKNPNLTTTLKDPSNPIVSIAQQDLRDRVKALHPDLIISTVAHHARWTQLAYDLNVPELVVHTDYEVDDHVVIDDGACKQPYIFDNNHLVKYCIPHEYNDPNKAKMKNQLSSSGYTNLVKEIGFPLRKEFQREMDPAKIEEIRKNLGFRHDERAVIMLGHREPDTTTMIKLIEQLKTTTRSFAAPICIVAVCGKELSVKKKVLDALQKTPAHPDIRVKIEGYLEAKELAEYMKAASRVGPFPGVMITKRGGSTTAEATEMGVYTIGLSTISEEECNGHYTNRNGLGEPYDQFNFIDQVSNALKWKGDRSTVYRSPFDWRTNLLALVNQKIFDSVASRIVYS